MPGLGVVDVPLGLLDQRVGELDQTGRRRPARGRAGTAAGRVATWSLRDRPARSLPPSSAEPLDSSPARARCARPRRRLARPELAGGAGRLEVVERRPASGPARRRSSRPAPGSTRACAREPARSYGASRQSNCDAHRQRGQRLGGAAGEPATPQARPVGRRPVSSVSRRSCAACRPRSRCGAVGRPRRSLAPQRMSVSPAGRPGRRPSGSAGPRAATKPLASDWSKMSPSS